MKIAFRVAAVLLALFALGHTVGTLAGHSPTGPAEGVLNAMREVHFDFNGSDRTFYAIFFGHSLLVSLYLLGNVLLCWWLSRVERTQWAFVAPLAWGLGVAQVLTAVIVGTHFFVGPTVLTSASAVLVLSGTVLANRASRSAER